MSTIRRKQKYSLLNEWESGNNQVYKTKGKRVKLQPNRGLVDTIELLQ